MMNQVFPLAQCAEVPHVPFAIVGTPHRSMLVRRILTSSSSARFDILSICFGEIELLAHGSMPAEVLSHDHSAVPFRLPLEAGVRVRVLVCWRGWPPERWWKLLVRVVSQLWRGRRKPPFFSMSLLGEPL